MIEVFKQSFLTVTTTGLTAPQLCLLFQVGVGVGRKKKKIARGGLSGFKRNRPLFLESYYQRVLLSLFQLQICILETIADQFL